MVPGFPLLGAGHGGLGEVASAACMLEVISASDEAQQVLKAIRFAVLEPRLARLVMNAAERFGLGAPAIPPAAG